MKRARALHTVPTGWHCINEARARALHTVPTGLALYKGRARACACPSYSPNRLALYKRSARARPSYSPNRLALYKGSARAVIFVLYLVSADNTRKTTSLYKALGRTTQGFIQTQPVESVRGLLLATECLYTDPSCSTIPVLSSCIMAMCNHGTCYWSRYAAIYGHGFIQSQPVGSV